MKNTRKKSDFLSSKTTDIYDAKAADYNVGSNISGDSVDLTSGKDTNITASNVVADNDVNITAGGNVNIIAVEDTSSSTYKNKSKNRDCCQEADWDLPSAKKNAKTSTTTKTSNRLAAL